MTIIRTYVAHGDQCILSVCGWVVGLTNTGGGWFPPKLMGWLVPAKMVGWLVPTHKTYIPLYV